MSMPDEIWAETNVPSDSTGSWGKVEIGGDTKYHSDAKYKESERMRLKYQDALKVANATNKRRAEKYQAMEARIDELFKTIEGNIENEAMSLGAVDGYDYNSGVEYGLRSALIIMRNARIDK